MDTRELRLQPLGWMGQILLLTDDTYRVQSATTITLANGDDPSPCISHFVAFSYFEDTLLKPADWTLLLLSPR